MCLGAAHMPDDWKNVNISLIRVNAKKHKRIDFVTCSGKMFGRILV